jgi:hypothetical protein
MIYDLTDPHDVNRFSCRANKLIDRQKTVELKEITTRSLKQNNYLHLILTAFAIETGYSVECVKQNFFKMKCNEHIFVQTVDGIFGTEITLRSSASLTKEEMTTAIDRFRNWSANNGYYLPEPNETEILKKIAVEQSKIKKYL